jgi:hypothetical protein
MIVGRVAELGQLDRLLADLLAGRGRALVLSGEAGIGKTTLLDALVERCGGDVAVLRTAGIETEAEIAFSALLDLLVSVVDDLDALPAPQSAALAAALALGPPQPGDRLAVCVATLGLLRATSRRRPVLVVVDDLQWLDAPSRECVLYAARRAGGPIAFALAVRDAEGAAGQREDLPELRLGRLGQEGSLEVLAQAAPDLAAPAALTLADAAAGNLWVSESRSCVLSCEFAREVAWSRRSADDSTSAVPDVLQDDGVACAAGAAFGSQGR